MLASGPNYPLSKSSGDALLRRGHGSRGAVGVGGLLKATNKQPLGISELATLEDGLAFCRKSFVAVGVFSAFVNLLMLTPAFFMLNAYDKALGTGSMHTLFMLGLITAFLFVTMGLLEWLRSAVLVKISSRLDYLLSPRAYELCFHNAASIGMNRGLATQPLNDLNGLRNYITGTGIFAFFDAPWLPIYLAVLFLFHPMLGWLGVGSACVLFVIAWLNQRLTTSPLEAANAKNSETTSATTRNLRNAEIASAMGMINRLLGRWRERQEEVIALQEDASRKAGAITATTKTLRMAIQSLALGAGVYLALAQEITPGMVIAGSLLIGRALAPVELAVGAFKGYASARTQYNRLSDLLRRIPPAKARMSLPPITGRLTAKGAVLAPPGVRKPTVQAITFDIQPGSTLLVMGASAAGKSTLVRGILGIWPTLEGELMLDGARASQYDREELGSQVGYLPQDIELFDGTVSDNIARFEDVDPEAVVQAAIDANVHELILALPQGYDTEIGGGNSALSPGQRQRIALARALYRRPKLIVLDEPNSNLDEAGERALAHAVTAMKAAGCTQIIVSHRQGLLPLADSIMIMDKGQIVDGGPAGEVLERMKQRALQAQQPAVAAGG